MQGSADGGRWRGERPGPRRGERTGPERRDDVREQIKRVALQHVQRDGAPGLSVNAVAKDLGVSGPALYRYFAGRDDLLGELVLDAYRDLAAAVDDAVRGTGTGTGTVAERVHAWAGAYRAWALAAPHRYRLLLAPPVRGSDAHSDRLVTAAQASMDVLLGVLVQVPAPAPPSADLRRQLGAWSRARGQPQVPVGAAAAAVRLWTGLHGLVSLELGGSLASMGLDGALLLQEEVDAVLRDPTEASEV